MYNKERDKRGESQMGWRVIREPRAVYMSANGDTGIQRCAAIWGLTCHARDSLDMMRGSGGLQAEHLEHPH